MTLYMGSALKSQRLEVSPTDATERYERLAAEFYRDTGMTAPGKDVPAAAFGDDFETRHNAWVQWMKARAAK